MIRRAKAKDIEKLMDIAHQNFILVNSKDYEKNIIKNMVDYYTKENFLKWISERVFLVYEKDEILGFVSLDGVDVCGLYVDVKNHGKGVGYKLMQAIEIAAVLEKNTVLRLDSSITAHDFYKKYGFIDIEPVSDDYFGPAFLMEKAVDPSIIVKESKKNNSSESY